MVYPEYIDNIIKRLTCHGESAYIVGGSLRDIFLGVPPHDYDVATSALPGKTVSIFSDMRVIETGIKHGTVTVISDGFPVEITTFRIDGEYTDSRHPESVSFTDDIVLDLSRRDFTVNAMAYNESVGLVDPFDGRGDIERRLIRAVGEPKKRFTEDALRIMRAFRFSAQLDFEIDADTLDGAVAVSEGLSRIARERISNEFLRLITSPCPEKALLLMKQTGILAYVLGDYAPSERIIKKLSDMPCTDVSRLGLLLSETNADTARQILGALRLSGKQTTGALAIRRGAELCVKTDTDARRLIAVTGIYSADAARVSEMVGASPKGAHDMTVRQSRVPCSVRDLKINGKDISSLGVVGKDIGDTLSQILERVIEEPDLNERHSLLTIAEQIIKQRTENDDRA